MQASRDPVRSSAAGGSPDSVRASAAVEALAQAREALRSGHPSLAAIQLDPWMRDPGASVEARYLAALAHARSGGYRAASALVDGLLADPAADAQRIEVLALAGRIAKDRWARLPEGSDRRAAGRQALACYDAAWQASGDPFPGINAASLQALLGDPAAARRQATAVRRIAASRVEDRWQQATLGEAALLLGEPEVAVAHYARARQLAAAAYGEIASMRRQLRLLAAVVAVEPLLAVLELPALVVFTGHMIDRPGRSPARFPAHLEAAVAAAIDAALQRLDAGFGYCSAACGADLLFAEAMLARGAELHLTLPFDRDDFVLTSVAPAGPGWVERFERVLQAASSVSYGVRERFLGDEALYAFAGALIQGSALQRATELQTTATMLAVCDPAAEPASGGTRDTLAHWRRIGLPSEVIDLASLRERHPAPPSTVEAMAPVAPAAAVRGTDLRRSVRTMLFADMVGYSRLAEEDTPAFLLNFLGAVAEIVRTAAHPPEFVNTWGDGLFMVFSDVLDAAGFALSLRDGIEQADWSACGLPAGTRIRIGMHSGPVFPAPDPLLGRRNYYGTHVNRAARIEPVALPGAVFISAEMAYSLAATRSPRFATEYLGTLPLAKGFAASPLYRLRRGDECE